MLCVIFRIPILGFTCLFFGRWQKSLKNDPFTLSNWIFHPFHDLHIFLNYNPKTILTVVFVIFLWSFFLVVLIYITIFDNLRSGNIMTITQHEVFWLTHLTVSGEKQVWWNKTHFYHRQCLIEMLTKRALFASWGRVEWDWHMEMSYLTSVNPQLFKNIAYVGYFHVFCPFIYSTHNSSEAQPCEVLPSSIVQCTLYNVQGR